MAPFGVTLIVLGALEDSKPRLEALVSADIRFPSLSKYLVHSIPFSVTTFVSAVPIGFGAHFAIQIPSPTTPAAAPASKPPSSPLRAVSPRSFIFQFLTSVSSR